MLRIWGRISSINVRKVVFGAQLLRIPFERVDAGAAFGIVQTPDYMAKNPNSLVPLLDDDGYTLWESNVILRYLCARHPGQGLYPEALRERFDAERWMDWQQTTLNPAGRDAFIQLIRVEPEQRNAQRIADSIAATEPLLDLLEAHLSQQGYMAGDRLTMADLPIACEMHRWRALPLAQRARPHLDRWYDGLRGLPAARGVLDIALT
jgi:glutathione S-transferase